jgi:general secretion pathway protein G
MIFETKLDIQKRNHIRDGFSIMEIMIAIAIIAIIGAVIVPTFVGYLKSAKVDKAKEIMRYIKGGVDIYQAQIGQWPNRLQDLVKKPSDEKVARKWREGAYLSGLTEVPEDPFGNPYQYKVTPGGKHPYELYSFGPDGREAKPDEWISVWTAD